MPLMLTWIFIASDNSLVWTAAHYRAQQAHAWHFAALQSAPDLGASRIYARRARMSIGLLAMAIEHEIIATRLCHRVPSMTLPADQPGLLEAGSKPWWTSQTVWCAIIAGLAPILAGTLHLTIDAGQVTAIGDGVATLLTIAGSIGAIQPPPVACAGSSQ